MSPHEIVDYLDSCGFDVTIDGANKRLTVVFDVAGVNAKLFHLFPDDDRLEALPVFFFENPLQFGHLAHIVSNESRTFGSVCIGDTATISINYEVPTLVYKYSLNRHIELIRRAATDPRWNSKELVREFTPNWALICDSNTVPLMYCATTLECKGSIQTKESVPKAKYGLKSQLLTLGSSLIKDPCFKTLRESANWEKRPLSGKSIMLTLDKLDPAPINISDLQQWYVSTIGNLSLGSKIDFQNHAKLTSRRHWLIFNRRTDTGVVRCAIRLTSIDDKKGKLPSNINECSRWKFDPVRVSNLDRDAVLPRSGAIPLLQDKKVLIVGCGSVGSELSQAVACAGVGSIHISDPEDFTIDNLYRHTLSLSHIGLTKSGCVASNLEQHYPWITTTWDCSTLQSKADVTALKQYDLVIVAIGSPTLERQFHDFVSSNSVKTPIMYTWLEGYGVGGHAILDIPPSPGCLRCAYLDPDTCGQGLASNLNFIAPDQDITVTLAGCGFQFIPYSGIASKSTAAMAADLAIRFLDGQLLQSSKVSWKGSSDVAAASELTLTHRYHHFTDSLVIQSLLNSECDACVN